MFVANADKAKQTQESQENQRVIGLAICQLHDGNLLSIFNGLQMSSATL
jgi:hypothetical protein